MKKKSVGVILNLVIIGFIFLTVLGIIKTIFISDNCKVNEKEIINIIDKKINELDKKIEELLIIKKVLNKIKTNVFIGKNICYRGKSLMEILNM